MTGHIQRARNYVRAGFALGDQIAGEIAKHPSIRADAGVGALIAAAAAAPALIARVDDARREVEARITKASTEADSFEREIGHLEAVVRFLTEGRALPPGLPADLALAARAIGGTDDAAPTARAMQADIEVHRRSLDALRAELPRARSALAVAAAGWRANVSMKTCAPDQAALSSVHKSELERHKVEFLRRRRIA